MRLEKRSFSAEKAFCAVNIAFRFAFASLCFERAWNLTKFGMAMAARMPMIATTIISSIRVKPFIIFFMRYSFGGITVGLKSCGRRVGVEQPWCHPNHLERLSMPAKK